MNKEERMALHLVYKVRMKDILHMFLGDVCAFIESEDVQGLDDKIIPYISNWVETHCKPEPDPRWDIE